VKSEVSTLPEIGAVIDRHSREHYKLRKQITISYTSSVLQPCVLRISRIPVDTLFDNKLIIKSNTYGSLCQRNVGREHSCSYAARKFLRWITYRPKIQRLNTSRQSVYRCQHGKPTSATKKVKNGSSAKCRPDILGRYIMFVSICTKC
jgi:hypothetical protein